jgi:oxygen-independent coproporphyrinogen-3 oxidase
MRKDYLGGKAIQTIYFGGGTPSLLSEKELEQLMEAVLFFYQVDLTEQTIECNPEDLSKEKLKTLRRLGFNRLSIGIQTFDDAILRFIHRIHTAEQAQHAVFHAKEEGFENITVDLIYALPHSSSSTLEADLEKIAQLDVPHVSAYCFTVEDKTVFGKWAQQKKLERNEDEFERAQYLLLSRFLSQQGYEQYEISNFARAGKYSKHNSAYWFGAHYLGIGPGAHSFNGLQRHWNISNNGLYTEQINRETLPQEFEELSQKDRFNETLLTQLRTKWGVDMSLLSQKFGIDLSKQKSNSIEAFIQNGVLIKNENVLFLTERGKLLADKIVADLML